MTLVIMSVPGPTAPVDYSPVGVRMTQGAVSIWEEPQYDRPL